jgi:hypothetical protein
VLQELDRSGGDAARPFWNPAIERVERGEVGAIVVWNLDRFSRSLASEGLALQWRINDAVEAPAKRHKTAGGLRSLRAVCGAFMPLRGPGGDGGFEPPRQLCLIVSDLGRDGRPQSGDACDAQADR